LPLQYLLVVATSAALHLYALSFDGDSVHGRMHVHETYYTLPTDGVVLQRVVGTAEGRIFCCGRDGALHEVCYYDYAAAGGGAAGGAVAVLQSAAAKVGGWIGEGLGIGRGVPLLAGPASKRARRVVQTGDAGSGAGWLGSVLSGLLRLAGSSLFTATPWELVDAAVDHDRRLLYTLGSDGSLRCYWLGPDPSRLLTQGGAGAAGGALAAAAAAAAGGAAGGYGSPLPDPVVCLDVEAACRSFCAPGAGAATPHDQPRPSAAKFRPGLAAAAAEAAAAGGSGAGAAPGAGLPSAAAGGAASVLGAAWPVASLHIVAPCDSLHVHLVTTSLSGVRTYWSTLSPQRFRERTAAGLGFAGGLPGAFAPVPVGAWGAPRERAGSDGVPGGEGSSLTVVHIALPPPAAARAEYCAGAYAEEGGGAGGRQAGFAPALEAPSASSLRGVVASHVAGGVTLVATAAGVAAGGGGGGSCRLVALCHDPLLHGRAAASRSDDSTLRESVQEVAAPAAAAGGAGLGWGMVHAIGEEPACPSLYRDAPFTQAGALALPQRDTCLVPGPVDAFAVRCGKRAEELPSPQAVRGLPVRTAGGAAHAGLGEAPTAADVAEALVVEAAGAGGADPLSNAGAAPRHHQVMRRRLWGVAGPGCSAPQAPVPDVSLELPDPAAEASSMRVFVVLTDSGVVKLARRRFIDQVAGLLRVVQPLREDASTAAAAAAAAATAGGAGRTWQGGSASGGASLAGTARQSGVFGASAAAAAAGGLRGGPSLAVQAYAFLAQQCVPEDLGQALVALACGAREVGGAGEGGAVGARATRSSAGGRSGFRAGGAAFSPPSSLPSSAAAAAVGSGGAALRPDSLPRRALDTLSQLEGRPKWRSAAPHLQGWPASDLEFSLRVGSLLLYTARLLRPFATQPALAWAPQEPQVDMRGAPSPLAAPRLRMLPRCSRGEAAALQQQLRSLAELLRRLFPFVSQPDEQHLQRALSLGMPALPSRGGAGGQGARGEAGAGAGGSSEGDRQSRANGLEIMYVVGLARLVERAAEAASLLAEVADAGCGGITACDDAARGADQATRDLLSLPDRCGLLALAVEGGPALEAALAAAAAIDTSTPAGQAQLRAEAAAPTRDLLRDSPGRRVAQELLPRMLAALQALPATLLPAASPPGAGGLAWTARSGLAATASSSSFAAGLGAAGPAAAAGAGGAAVALASRLREVCPAYFSAAQRHLLEAEARARAAAEAASPAERAAHLDASKRAAAAAVSSQDGASLASSLPGIVALSLAYARIGDLRGAAAIVVVAATHLAASAASGAAGSPAASLPADYAAVAGAVDVEGAMRGFGAALAKATAGAGRGLGLAALRQDADVQAALAPVLATPSATAQRVQLYALLLALLQACRAGTVEGGRPASSAAAAAASAPSSAAFADLYADLCRVPDALLHDTLFRWLQREGEAGLLLASPSPHLQGFLEGRAGDEALLVRYLTRQGQAGRAARRLAGLALSREPGPSVAQRVDWLEQAAQLAALPRSSQGGEAVSEGERQRWGGQALVLRAQLRLLQAVRASEAACGAGSPPQQQWSAMAAALDAGGVFPLHELLAYAQAAGMVEQQLLIISESRTPRGEVGCCTALLHSTHPHHHCRRPPAPHPLCKVVVLRVSAPLPSPPPPPLQTRATAASSCCAGCSSCGSSWLQTRWRRWRPAACPRLRARGWGCRRRERARGGAQPPSCRLWRQRSPRWGGSCGLALALLRLGPGPLRLSLSRSRSPGWCSCWSYSWQRRRRRKAAASLQRALVGCLCVASLPSACPGLPATSPTLACWTTPCEWRGCPVRFGRSFIPGFARQPAVSIFIGLSYLRPSLPPCLQRCPPLRPSSPPLRSRLRAGRGVAHSGPDSWGPRGSLRFLAGGPLPCSQVAGCGKPAAAARDPRRRSRPHDPHRSARCPEGAGGGGGPQASGRRLVLDAGPEFASCNSKDVLVNRHVGSAEPGCSWFGAPQDRAPVGSTWSRFRLISPHILLVAVMVIGAMQSV